MAEISETTEGIEQLLPIESLKVDEKLTITAIPLKRYPNPLSASEGRNAEALKAAVAKVIEEADGVIFEYFPEETARLSSSPLFLERHKELYERVMNFFGPLAELTKEHKKPAYVFDPAYDEKFAALFQLLPSTIASIGMPIGEVAAFLGIGALIGKLPSGKLRKETELRKKKELPQEDKEESGVTRRQFLKGASVAAGVLAAGTTLASYRSVKDVWKEVVTGTPSPGRFPNENKFRRAVIAKGIFQLSENLDKDSSGGAKKLVLLYPPLHWKGLKELLQDKRRLEEEFGLYSMLKQGGMKDAFFTARKYEWTGKEWSLEKAEIGGSPGPAV